MKCTLFMNIVSDLKLFQSSIYRVCGPGSSVGTATTYGLDGSGIEFRWDEIFRTCPDRP